VREGSLFDALGAKVSGSDPLALMVQVMGHISDRRTETALRLLGNYLREHPEACLMALPFVRLADRDYPFFPTEEKWEIFGRLLRNTERQPCDCLEFNLWVIQQMRSAKMGADAGQFLAHLLEGSPQNPVLLEEAYSFAKEENIQELKRAVTRALEELGPDHHWGQLMLWRLAKDSGNTAMEQRCLEQLQHLFPLSRYRADYFDFIGAHPQAVEALEEQLTLTPEDAAIAEAIAGQYQKMGRIEDQMTWLQKALALDPTRSEAVVDLMNLHLYWGNPEKAEALLNSYLSHEPESASVRVLLSHLLGETEFEAYRLSTEDLLQLAATQGESSADSELILDQMVIRLFPDGSQLRYTHLVTRVRTKKGIDEESEILLPRRHELLELRTIKPDGRIIFPEILPHKNSVSLTDLTVGDLIDEEHIEVVPPSSFDRDGANNDMTFVFQSDSRFYHHSEIVIIYPEDLKVAPEFLERHYPQKVETSRKGGLIHKRWLMKNNAPLETEPHMPSPGGFFPRMTFNYNTTWEDLRDFHVDGMARRRKMGQALHAWLAPFQGRSADRETAQAVYDAVMAEVEPVGTFLNPIDQLWHQKKGNPALLLWSLYEQLGFEVRLLLSQPRQARNQVFFVPHLSLFQHPLVQLTFEDEIVILETGLPHFPFGQFPYDFAGGEALVIDPFASPLVTLPETFGPQKEVASLYQMTLDAQGTLRGSGEERFNGALASRLHQYHQGVTDKERLQQVENSVNHNFPGARLLEVSVNEVPKGSFALTFLMETESWLPPLTDGMEIPFLLPKNKLYETYTSAPQRRFPLRLGEPVTNDARIELTLPAGMTWHLTPSVQEEDSPFGTYRLALSLSSPQTLVMHRVYSLHQEEIAPEDYSAFQAFCRSLRALENRVFTLRKTDGNP
jgi:tetratricopeptide (TPR) repeat protein